MINHPSDVFFETANYKRTSKLKSAAKKYLRHPTQEVAWYYHSLQCTDSDSVNTTSTHAVETPTFAGLEECGQQNSGKYLNLQ